LLEEPSRISANGNVRFQLYKLLGEVLTIDGPASFNVPPEADADCAESAGSLKRRVADLPILTRHLLLLVTLEGFSVRRAAELFDIPEFEAEAHLLWARRQLRDRESAPIAISPNARLDYPVYRYSSGSRPRTNSPVA
jgi:DNA-directed RNA polymerase specialized sigma24 family protein